MHHLMIEQTFTTPPNTSLETVVGEDSGAKLERAFTSRDGLRHLRLYRTEQVSDGSGLGMDGAACEHRAYAVHTLMHCLPPRPEGYSLVVAQRNLSAVPGISIELVQHLLTDPLGCGQRLRLSQLGAYLAHDLQRMVCVYFAPDIESVRKANRENGVPWEHLWRGEAMLP